MTFDIESDIPHVFERQVQENAGRIAVKEGDACFTYDQLNRRANGLARAIEAAQPGAGKPVALLLDRQSQSIVAILATLKVGHFYVNIDPTHPQARNAFIVGDSQASLIVASRSTLALARELSTTAKVINMDDHQGEEDNFAVSLSPDDYAYLQYTSGSTGMPKGVIQNHRNVLHSARTYTNGFRISPDDRLCPVRNIFIALLNGAAIYCYNPKREGVAGLKRVLAEERITMYLSVPSVYRQLIQTLGPGDQFPDLRLVHLEGEQVYGADIAACRTHFNRDCVFVNRFATTETGSIRWFFADGNTPCPAGSVPAGHAVDDKEVILLDDGEIAVKSRYLSPGYWQRPDLTDAVFLPDPADGRERIYLTGDVGRMNAGGLLEHLGRKDFQVKIRGNRIEAAEVEAAILDCGGVREVVVVAREDRLVAYIVGGSLSTRRLRGFLEARLPVHMVPAVFVVLDRLPRTANGKVDRLALPAPEILAGPDEPSTPSEVELAAIWAQALRVERVGVHDDFMESGGHSLAAMQIISRVSRAFQVDLPLSNFNSAPTVSKMALEIDRLRDSDPEFSRLLSEIESLSDTEAQALLG